MPHYKNFKKIVVGCKNNKFKKPAGRFERHHAGEYEFSKTASAMLRGKIIPFNVWVDYIDEHEKAYLLQKKSMRIGRGIAKIRFYTM